MLLATWFDEPHRATRDVDLLGFGDAAEDALVDTFREIMAVEVDDGVTFDLDGLRLEAIRKEVEYGGSRVRTTAALAGARIPITVDIGFGDAVEPGVELRTSIFRCSSTCRHHTCALIRQRLSSPRSFTRWWSWVGPTAA